MVNRAWSVSHIYNTVVNRAWRVSHITQLWQSRCRLEGFVRKFGAKASKAASAQSKQKLADKLRGEMVEAPSAAASTGGGDAKKVGGRFHCLQLRIAGLLMVVVLVHDLSCS